MRREAEGYKLIIHIGMHKTGSYSIQQSLAKNFSNPTDEIVYFKFNGIINHNCIVYPLFLDNPYQYKDFVLLNYSLAEKEVYLNNLKTYFYIYNYSIQKTNFYNFWRRYFFSF